MCHFAFKSFFTALGKSEATPQPAPRRSLVWSRSLPEDTPLSALSGQTCSTNPIHSIFNNTCSSGGSLSSFPTYTALHRPTRPTIQDCAAAPRWSRALGGPVSSSMETGDHASWSSYTSSLVPCHGSVESLPGHTHNIGTPQPPRLPKDTMLDRVLRCLGAGQVAWTSDHLPQSTLQNLGGHCLGIQHNTSALQPDHFLRSHSSLEEGTFPEDKSGAVCSAAAMTPISSPTVPSASPTTLSPNCTSVLLSASLPPPSSVSSASPCTLPPDQLTTLSTSSPSVLPFNSTPTLSHAPLSTPSCKPEDTDQLKQDSLTEMVITPPKEFQEGGKSLGTSSPTDTLIPGSFRLITEQEYHQNIGGSKGLPQEVKSGGSGNTISEYSLTNLEHPARSAYLRLLLSQPPPVPPPPVPVPLKKCIISDTEEPVTQSKTPTSEYSHHPVPLEQLSSEQSVVSSTAGHTTVSITTTMATTPIVTTTNTRDAVRSSTLNKENIKSDIGKAHENETSGSLLSRRRHTGRGCLTSLRLNTLCSKVPHGEVTKEAHDEGAGGEDVTIEEVSSNSSNSSPPPIDFTTHPLTPDPQFSDSFTLGLLSYPMPPDPIFRATFTTDTLPSSSPAVDPISQDSYATTAESHIPSSMHMDIVPSQSPTVNMRITVPHAPDSGCSKKWKLSSTTESDKTRKKNHSRMLLSTTTPWYDDPRILSKRSDARPTLHKMYPDSDSDDSSNSNSSSSPKEKNIYSLDSEKSEETLDLFINNPEPLVLHRVNLGRNESASPDGDKDSLLSNQADGGDGWGVDAGPSVPESLLNINDEEFEHLMRKIVADQPSPESDPFSLVSHDTDTDDIVKVTRSTSPTRKTSFSSKEVSGINKTLPSPMKTSPLTTSIINSRKSTMSSHGKHSFTEFSNSSPFPVKFSTTTTIPPITKNTLSIKHSIVAPKDVPTSKNTSSAFTKNTFVRTFSEKRTNGIHHDQQSPRIVSIVSKSSPDLSSDSPTTLEQAPGIVTYPQNRSLSLENPAVLKQSSILPEKNSVFMGNVTGSCEGTASLKKHQPLSENYCNPGGPSIYPPKTCFSPEKAIGNPKWTLSSTKKVSVNNVLAPVSSEKTNAIQDCPVLNNFDYYNNGQSSTKHTFASPEKDPTTQKWPPPPCEEVPSMSTGAAVSSEKVTVASRGYHILSEDISKIPKWAPVSPKKVSSGTPSGSTLKISNVAARGYRSAAIKESSASNIIHPDIAKHMPTITKVFPPVTTIARNYTTSPPVTITTTFPTTLARKCTSVPVTTATIVKNITSEESNTVNARLTTINTSATPKFCTATTAYIPALSSFFENSMAQNDNQTTISTTTITTNAHTDEDKGYTTSKKDVPTISASTTTNTINTTFNAVTNAKDFSPTNITRYVHGISTMSINITPSNKDDTLSTPSTAPYKDDTPATSKLQTTPSSTLYCTSTKYIPASRNAPVPARYTIGSSSHLPRASSQPDLFTASSGKIIDVIVIYAIITSILSCSIVISISIIIMILLLFS